MKRIIIILMLLIVVVSTFYIVLKQPSSMVKSPVVIEQKNTSEPASVKQNKEQLNTTQKVNEKLLPKGSSNNVNKAPQVSTPVIAGNSAAQFDKLPKAMQEQIKQLSGRNNPNVQPIEVEPGVFLIPAGKGVNVVPVAVVNEDGTVSTHEY